MSLTSKVDMRIVQNEHLLLQKAVPHSLPVSALVKNRERTVLASF
jgi:hypothetical protein